jgi:hypothetical protein
MAMRLPYPLTAVFACVLFVSSTSRALADVSTDPVRLVPAQADLILRVERPRTLVEGLVKHELFRQLQALETVRELLASTNSRRFYQLVAHIEKQLGTDRLDLLDRLAGGGVTLAARFTDQPPTVLLIVQAKDQSLLQRFAKLAEEIGEQELARLENKQKLEHAAYRGIEGVRLGKEFHAALVGSALIASNSERGLRAAIDLHLDGDAGSMARSPQVAAARKLLPAAPAAWLWVNLKPAHEQPQFKAIFDAAKDSGVGAIFFGGLFNIAARAPFLCAALFENEGGLAATVRFPRGREGMHEAVALHLPGDANGSLPVLEPPNTLVSASYYLDLANLWNRRAKLFKPNELKGIEELEKKSGLFLGGVKLSKLIQQTGPHQRIVVAAQTKAVYKVAPGLRLPAFALVLEMRDPEFARTAEAVLRAAALVGTFQFNLSLVEEKHGTHTIVGYRFPEDGKLAADVANIRFNFTPCLVKVGNQFIVSSTLQLAHDLVDAVEKEAGSAAAHPSTLRIKGFATGAASALRAGQDQLFTQIMLSQALAPDVARAQVQALIALVEQLGTVTMQTYYGANEFHVDFLWRLRN